ncbi:MAG: transketolase family protein, partial [Clostridia bacterium]|nr:transketolase family protein [Clostridia bacterium]
AEGNMISTAAGIATCGIPVFAASFAMFSSGRAFEQVRNSVCYPKLNVKVVGTHGGISVGEDGATHQCIEDISLMRTIPGMVVINPCDAIEAKQAVKAALEHNGPVYLRFCRLATENIHNEDFKFEIGKGVEIKDGNDVTIVATGIVLEFALKAAEILKAEGISARVVDIHTIKPIDKDIIVKAAKETGAIVTVEEHNVYGGLGSAVAEVVCEEKPVPVLKVGVQDKFGTSGKPAELFELYNITPEYIAQKAKEAIKIK